MALRRVRRKSTRRTMAEQALFYRDHREKLT
jgi:hypothetical protein